MHCGSTFKNKPSLFMLAIFTGLLSGCEDNNSSTQPVAVDVTIPSLMTESTTTAVPISLSYVTSVPTGAYSNDFRTVTISDTSDCDPLMGISPSTLSIEVGAPATSFDLTAPAIHCEHEIYIDVSGGTSETVNQEVNVIDNAVVDVALLTLADVPTTTVGQGGSVKIHFTPPSDWEGVEGEQSYSVSTSEAVSFDKSICTLIAPTTLSCEIVATIDSSVNSGNYTFTITPESGTEIETNTSILNYTVTGFQWLSISGHISHTCAIASDNNAYCWGRNSSGQLGSGSIGGESAVPLAVNSGAGAYAGQSVISISSGHYYTCAVANDHNAYCWGRNNFGQLGSGSIGGETGIPLAVNSGAGAYAGETITSISTGVNQTCTIASDNNAYCWGRNNFGQLGSGSIGGDIGIPLAVNSGAGAYSGQVVTSISAGLNYTCAIASDKNAYCWGRNNFGQLGSGSIGGDIGIPLAVNSGAGDYVGQTITSISTGIYHTCTIASDRNAYCWGRNNVGQLGSGSIGGETGIPLAVDSGAGAYSGQTVTSISSSFDYTCATASDYNAYCWGRNNFGQLGSGSIGGETGIPLAVDSGAGAYAGQTVMNISADGNHTCAIASDHNAYCWGRNNFGQLGSGSTGGETGIPLEVLEP